MELKFQIFNAVYSDSLRSLQKLLGFLPKPIIKTIVSCKLDGATPLLVATRFGYYEIVDYLIKYCEADIEQVGKVEFDGETVHDTPPLWCAAAAGNLNCVKLLLEHGANINCTTQTNSTPLRAACFDGHFEIVKYLVENGANIEIANKHGHTCLMISCYKGHFNIASYLIDKGCLINRQSVKGNTALHDCAESNNMEIIKLLIRNGAIFQRDCFGLNPMMTAVISGNIEMFNYLKSVFNCTIEDEADAYKLLGTTFVDKFYNLTEAFKYWRIALNLSTKCNKEYHELLVNHSEYYLKAYGNVTEFKSEEELDNLFCDPDLMKIQSLIIRERILSIRHPETFFFIRFHGTNYAEAGDYARCLSLWMYNLDRQQNTSKPLSDITQNSFVLLIEFFNLMCFNNNEYETMVCDIFKVFKMAVTELFFALNASNNYDRLNSRTDCNYSPNYDRYSMLNCRLNGIDRQCLIIIHLIGFMCHFRSKISSTDWMEFKRLIHQLLSCDPVSRKESHSLLHIICILAANKQPLSSTEISLIEIFKFIVDQSPYNLNLRDSNRNTCLHLLMQHENVNVDMVSYLIQSMAHIDLRNSDGQTPFDYSKGNLPLQRMRLNYGTLQCICAQVIVRHNHVIPLDKLPKEIRSFVMDHQ